MTLADKYGWPIAIIIGLALIIVIFGIPFYLCLLFFRWYEKAAQKALNRIVASVNVSDNALKYDVEIEYHTYHGLLAWATQTKHRYILNAENAKLLLKKLRNYNLTWGILAAGCVFIPILAVSNYWVQLRKVRKQINKNSYQKNSGD